MRSPVRTGKPYWQNHWNDLHFRADDEHAFTRLGSESLRRVSNAALLTTTVEAFADSVLG